MTTAEKILLILRMQGGGTPTWVSTMNSFNPLVWYDVSDPVGDNVANNLGTLGSAQDGTYTSVSTRQLDGLTATGSAALFNNVTPSNSRITTPSLTTPSAELTALFLFRHEGTITSFNTLLGGGTDFVVTLVSGGGFRAFISTGDASCDSITGLVTATAAWHLVAATLSNGDLTIYHTSNGTVSDVSLSRTGVYTNPVVMVGANWGRRFSTTSPRYDEFALFPTALSLANLQALADTLTW
jgi:hypothetical protein